MKPTLLKLLAYVLLSLLILFGGLAYGQDLGGTPVQGNNKCTLYLLVKNGQGTGVAGLDVWLDESGTGEVLRGTTDNNGRLAMTLINGHTYVLNMKGQEKYGEINTPPRGGGRITKTVMYRPERFEEYKAISEASKQEPTGPMQTIEQNYNARTNPTRTEALIKVQVKDDLGRFVPNVPVKLVCNKIARTFAATSGYSGTAFFLVPNNNHYSISLAEMDGYQFLTLPNKPGMVYTRTLKYVPTNVEEAVVNDTVRQKLDAKARATSARTLVKIKVKNMQQAPLPDEEVILTVKGSERVYFAETASDGYVRFLIPKGITYELHFKYDRNVDLLKIEDDRSIENINIEFTYMGSLAIEAFYARAGRNTDGFIVDFNESKITRLASADYKVTRTDLGIDIDFGKKTEVTTPTVYNNKMYVNGGFYSPEVYCLDPKTGAWKWGVELAEGGASSAVFEDDVILVNTESCTIYAIDAITGNMLWSKWLSPYLFTTPSVKDNKVYTVYGNNLSSYDTKQSKRNFVLACFDLKTGKIAWQNWLNAEGMAAPVVTNKHVYVTTVAGSLYQFDVATGKNSVSKAINATTPPTVVNGKVYVGTKKPVGEGFVETVKALSASNMEFIAGYKAPTTVMAANGMDKAYPCWNMNYSGSRMTHFNNRNYQVLGDKLICTDPNNGSILWSADISEKPQEMTGATASAPVLSGNKVLISTTSGKVQLYDPAKGTKVKEYATGTTMWSEPTVANGWIYAGGEDGKMVAINTKDPEMTGWGMWGYDGSHNPVVMGKDRLTRK